MKDPEFLRTVWVANVVMFALLAIGIALAFATTTEKIATPSNADPTQLQHTIDAKELNGSLEIR